MATRMYFPSTTVAPVSPVANGSWGFTTEQSNGRLSPRVLNTSQTNGTTIGPWTSGQTAADRRYVSPSLRAPVTISGTVKMQLLVQEQISSDNSTSRVEIYVVSKDGSTVTGTLLAIGQAGPATEYDNNLRNKTFISSGTTLTSVSTNEGDRIVVVVGHSDNSGITPEAIVQFGDAVGVSDLPEDETATSGRGWIEFSQNLVFIEEGELELVAGVAESCNVARIRQVEIVASGVKHVRTGG